MSNAKFELKLRDVDDAIASVGDNPGAVAGFLIRRKAEVEGLPLADDFDQQVANLAAYFDEPVEYKTDQ